MAPRAQIGGEKFKSSMESPQGEERRRKKERKRGRRKRKGWVVLFCT
jgi:hypothetical protein